MTQARLLAIHVGRPQRFGTEGAKDPMQRPWWSATVKTAVSGPIFVGRENIEGDRQADRQGHGGPDKAVLLYSQEHYPGWHRELARSDLRAGAFGENFTVSDRTEEDVCIGDVFTVGESVLQVAQPRKPCWKQSRRWQIVDLSARMEQGARIGWYARVLQEGYVEAGQDLKLVSRCERPWSVAHTYAVISSPEGDPNATAELAECEVLATVVRERLKRALRAMRS